MEPDTEDKWNSDYSAILSNYLTPYVKERIYRFILTDSLTELVPRRFMENVTEPVISYIMNNIAFECNNQEQLIDRRDTLFADSIFYYYYKTYEENKELQKQYKSLYDYQLQKLREYIRKKLDEKPKQDNTPAKLPSSQSFFIKGEERKQKKL